MTAQIEVLVAHSERATLRVGDVFLKIDTDQSRIDVEVAAIKLAPVPTPQILWRKPPVIALAEVRGRALGKFGTPSPVSAGAWRAAGAAIRTVHDAPLPPWPGWNLDEFSARLDHECAWLVDNDALPREVVMRNGELAQTALRQWKPVFTHGDLQPDHIFVDGDEVTGVIDWSDACQGDALFDLAVLTLGHPERLDDVAAGYGADLDRGIIRAWWSFRCLLALRWLTEHGFGRLADMPETAVLRRLAG
jgi:aminoglycoside phosphotransferase (APT) family kinase protein